MKILLALLLLTLPAAAQLPPSLVPTKEAGRPVTQPFVPSKKLQASLYAKGIGAGKISETNWKTSWGSYSKDYESQHHVEVIVTGWGGAEAKVEIQSIWFGRTAGKNSKRVILSKDSQEVTVRGGALGESYLLHSPAALSNVTNWVGLGYKETEGTRLEGWYVALLMDGRVIADSASAGHLVDLARNPAALANLQGWSTSRQSALRPDRPAPEAIKVKTGTTLDPSK